MEGDRFRNLFNAKVASGLSPNEAAAATILALTEAGTEESDVEEDEEEETMDREKVWQVFSSVEGMRQAFLETGKKRRRKEGTGIRGARRVLERIVSSGDERLSTTLKNALEFACAELTGKQGDANSAIAWCVLLEHPEIASSKSLLRTALMSLGACGADGRKEFCRLAASVRGRRVWGNLVQDHLTVLAATGAEHSEILHAARALDVIADVDGLASIRDSNEVLNERIAEDDTLVLQAFRNWGGPGTSILNYPYLLDTGSKSKFLRVESRREMYQTAMAVDEDDDQHDGSPYFVVAVNRESLVQDAMRKLVGASDSELRKQLKVAFRGEDAVDEGGVANEFMQLALRQLLSPAYGMFTGTTRLWFARHTFDSVVGFELVGILLGVAIHNSILVDASFPKYLWKKLVGGGGGDDTSLLEDVEDIDAATANSLRAIAADGFDLEATELYYQASYDSYGASKTVDLCENGANVRVTEKNKAAYVDAYVAWFLDAGEPYRAFEKGFKRVCSSGGRVFQLLNYQDLELLVRGSPTLDFDAWKSAVVYEGYHDHSETVSHFWQVVEVLEHPLKVKLLKFVTGSDRAPIGGLVNSKFVISRSTATAQLPSSHTCFHHLVLPDYKDIESLRTKLLIAINESSEGFGLR